MNLLQKRLSEMNLDNYVDISRDLGPKYEVVGGVYTDLTFETVEPGQEERYGPFLSYPAAYTKWMEVARFKVDNARHRVTIRRV